MFLTLFNVNIVCISAKKVISCLYLFSRRGESSSATNRGSRKFDKNISERKRPFSRSPFRSSNSNRDDQFKVPFKTIKPGYEHHQRSSTGSSGTYHQADYSQYPSSRFNNSASMNDFHHSSDNLYDNFNNSTAITVDPTRRGPNRTLDKQSYDGGRSRISDSARSNRRSPFSNGRRSSPRRSDSKNSSSMFLNFFNVIYTRLLKFKKFFLKKCIS